jgi:hypothetical protein
MAVVQELGRAGAKPLLGRSRVYRCLKRHNLIELRRSKKRRDAFRRSERDRPMQLWQMDVMPACCWMTAPISRSSPGSTITAASA